MNALDRLKGQKVIAQIEDDEIEGIVLDYDINDFYFYQKNEPIEIHVSVMMHDEVDEYSEDDFDEEDDDDMDMGYALSVPLSDIRKA